MIKKNIFINFNQFEGNYIIPSNIIYMVLINIIDNAFSEPSMLKMYWLNALSTKIDYLK